MGRGVRWGICLLLFLATTINYIDRQILSLLKPILDEQLRWTNADFGYVNAAFTAAYAVGLLLFGPFIDRVGTKIGYAVSIAAWSLAAIGHSLVGSAGGFLRARAALGLGEGGNFPSAIKTVALWFPKKERALATALFNSGANVGAVIAPALVPWIASGWGWRAAFVVAGCAGFVWLLLWLPFYDLPERSKALSPEELAFIRSDRATASPVAGQPFAAAAAAAAETPVTWASILGYRQAWSFIVGKLLTDPVWWFFLIWLPDYFKKARGLDIKKSWVHLVSIYLIVTVLSVAGGWLVGYLTRRGMNVSRARKTAMLLFALAVLPILAVTKVSDVGAVILIGVAGAAHQAWSANLFTTVSDMFPQQAVASVVGIGGMAGAVGGIAFPIYAGKLLDSFQAQGNAGAAYGILFAYCGSAYLIAFGLSHLLAPKFTPVELR
jgi:ACS family hexuronate transporter-like MFS transporter